MGIYSRPISQQYDMFYCNNGCKYKNNKRVTLRVPLGTSDEQHQYLKDKKWTFTINREAHYCPLCMEAQLERSTNIVREAKIILDFNQKRLCPCCKGETTLDELKQNHMICEKCFKEHPLPIEALIEGVTMDADTPEWHCINKVRNNLQRKTLMQHDMFYSGGSVVYAMEDGIYVWCDDSYYELLIPWDQVYKAIELHKMGKYGE